jgi:hypothetical protein
MDHNIETSIGAITKKEFVSKANKGTLPENLKIYERLLLNEYTSLKTLPKGLQVSGYLSLWGCSSLTSLPEGLQVGGDLFLQGCTSLTSLPKELLVGKSLYLKGCTSLTALPSDMKVELSIYVDKSFIQNYPFKDIPKILHLPFENDLKQILRERLK